MRKVTPKGIPYSEIPNPQDWVDKKMGENEEIELPRELLVFLGEIESGKLAVLVGENLEEIER